MNKQDQICANCGHSWKEHHHFLSGHTFCSNAVFDLRLFKPKPEEREEWQWSFDRMIKTPLTDKFYERFSRLGDQAVSIEWSRGLEQRIQVLTAQLYAITDDLEASRRIQKAGENEILRLSGLLRVSNTERNDAQKRITDFRSQLSAMTKEHEELHALWKELQYLLGMKDEDNYFDLRTPLRAITAENESLKADKDRLDWYNLFPRFVKWSEEQLKWSIRKEGEVIYFDTLRSAINEARKTEKEDKP